MIFFNRCFDKNRLKNLIYWSLMNQGEQHIIELIEKLKDLGFSYATQAGISLGIDDLKIPPDKFLLISHSEKDILKSQNEYQRGNITAIEKFQKMIDIWHKTSEILKSNVVSHFKSTDLLNPVYMMAFSGARGSISQVRQLVGMRGLMADPQGQIIEFPIRSNFREGLTLTEYIISCYGARKGLVDTALRTANSGYLTRRLVDVGQHILVSQLDCGTDKGIYLSNMTEGNKIILPLQTRLLGRILAEEISLLNDMILVKNTDISASLSAQIIQIKNKVLVRSPLTCEAKNSICQLCYGWSLAHGNMVSLGEAVGILAAQSIGEPGTQLTMRTFHTGGVFSGDIMDEIRAPFSGKIFFKEPLPGTLIRTPHGKIAFLTKIDGEFSLKADLPQVENFLFKTFKIPSLTVLFVHEGEKVFKNQLVAEISSLSKNTNQRIQSTHHLNSDFEGEIYFENVVLGVKIGKEGDIIQSARKLGSLWILSGKIYKSIVPLTSFPQISDLVNKSSIMNQSILKTPYTGMLEFQREKKSNTNHILKNKINFKNFKFLKKIDFKNNPKKNLKINSKNNDFFFKQPLINLTLQKIKFQKFGYFFSISSPLSTPLIFNETQIKNDEFFLYNSNSKQSLVDYQKNRINKNQHQVLIDNLNSIDKKKKFSSFQFSWFPKSFKTNTGGLIYRDQYFLDYEMTSGQIFWVPEERFKIRLYPELLLKRLNFIEYLYFKKIKNRIISKGLKHEIFSKNNHKNLWRFVLQKNNLNQFFKIFSNRWVKKNESILYKSNFQQKNLSFFSKNDGLIELKALNKGKFNFFLNFRSFESNILSNKKNAFARAFLKKLKFRKKNFFYKNPLNLENILKQSSKNKKITHIYFLTYFSIKYLFFREQLAQSKKNKNESNQILSFKNLKINSNFYLNKSNKKYHDIEFNVKPGWVYFPINQKKSFFFHKNFIAPGSIIFDNLVFDQCLIYVECLPIFSQKFKKSNFFINIKRIKNKKFFLSQKINKQVFSNSHSKEQIVKIKNFKGIFSKKLNFYTKQNKVVNSFFVNLYYFDHFFQKNNEKIFFNKKNFFLNYKKKLKKNSFNKTEIELKRNFNNFTNQNSKSYFKDKNLFQNFDFSSFFRIHSHDFFSNNFFHFQLKKRNLNRFIYHKRTSLNYQKFLILFRKVLGFSIIKNSQLKNNLLKFNKKSLFIYSSQLIDFNKQTVSNLFLPFPGVDIKIQSTLSFQNIKLTPLLTKTNIFDILVSFLIPFKFPFKHLNINLLFLNTINFKFFMKENLKLMRIKHNLVYHSLQILLIQYISLNLNLFFEFSLIRRIELLNFLQKNNEEIIEKMDPFLSNSSKQLTFFKNDKLDDKKLFSSFLLLYQKKTISNKNAFALSSFFSPYQGEILSKQFDLLNKQSFLILTPLDQISFFIGEKKAFTYIGHFIRFGDKLAKNICASISGQVIQIDKQKIILRKAHPVLFSSRGVFHVQHGDFVEKNTPLLTLFYQRLKTGDIVQGIPKIEEFFEARQTKEGEILPENLHTKLKEIFQQFKQKFNSQEASRKSIEKIQQILVEGVQRVYQSQGVTISDKHIEIIVRQMTSKVKIIEGGQTGLLRGELIDLEWIELVNKGIETQKAEYEPVLLGITKASLETESFISAASFQETTRILSRAAIERKTDFLRGLKENVILGHLIPAGTGFSLSFDPESSKYIQKNKFKNYNYFFKSFQ